MANEIVVYRSDGVPMLLPAGLELTHEWHSWAAVGGPEELEIRAQGEITALWETARWLRRRVEVKNELGDWVWWGMIAEVELTLGAGLRIGLSLDNMYNYVRVKYTWEDADGALRSDETNWGEDGVSIARYGYKELQQSQADTSAAAATALRDRLLSKLGKPHGAVAPAGGRETVGARLQATGWWRTLGWRYYQQLAGREGYEASGGKAQALGVAKAAATIGFREEPRRVFDVGTGFMVGHRVVVAGSGSNNGTYEVASNVEQDAFTRTATTISFTAQDDIYDSGAGLSGLRVGDVVQVEGSDLNDGIYEIKSFDGTNDHLEVAEKGIVVEAAGDSVTIRRRTYLTTVEELNEEDAGASVTLTLVGVKLAQSFTLENNVAWTAAEVTLRVRKVGSPADELKVELCGSSGGNPGSVLDSGMIDPDDMTTGMDWRVAALSNSVTLTYGTTYWLVISRTGSNDADNYYVVDVSEEAEYTLGSLKLWNGSAWVTRNPDADLPFVVWGEWETTEQLEQLATACGQFFTAVEVVDASGVYARQYREGDNYALDEARELLEMGASDGRRMLAMVTRERRLLFYKQPESNSSLDWQLGNDGAVVSPLGEPIAPGKTPAGRWVHLKEIPGQIDAVAPLSPFFVERAQYFADGRLSLEPEGAPSPYEIGQIEQG
jgi:hypothetical protein